MRVGVGQKIITDLQQNNLRANTHSEALKFAVVAVIHIQRGPQSKAGDIHMYRTNDGWYVRFLSVRIFLDSLLNNFSAYNVVIGVQQAHWSRM